MSHQDGTMYANSTKEKRMALGLLWVLNGFLFAYVPAQTAAATPEAVRLSCRTQVIERQRLLRVAEHHDGGRLGLWPRRCR
jgi:hypothetical protein